MKPYRKPKFGIGVRVAVADYDKIQEHMRHNDWCAEHDDRPRYSSIPLIGWVIEHEPMMRGNRQVGWWIRIQGDDKRMTHIRYTEWDLVRVPLKRFERSLSRLDSAVCPWCIKHGAVPGAFVNGMHINVQECTCWHHSHREHMPECPYR